MKILFVAVVALIALARANPAREIHDGDDDDHEENCHCGVFVGEVEILHLHPWKDIENCNRANACKNSCKREWKKEFGDGSLDHVHEGKTLGQWLCQGAANTTQNPNIQNVMPEVQFYLCTDDWAQTGKMTAENLCCYSGQPIACNSKLAY